MPLKLLCTPRSLVPLSHRRVCTLRGLQLSVSPWAVNSAMICHWYTPGQVEQGIGARPATWAECPLWLSEMWYGHRAMDETISVLLWVFDPHYGTHALFSLFISLFFFPSLCLRFKAGFVWRERDKRRLYNLPCVSVSLFTRASSDLPLQDNYRYFYYSSPLYYQVIFQALPLMINILI